jgi:hypothetical protein
MTTKKTRPYRVDFFAHAEATQDTNGDWYAPVQSRIIRAANGSQANTLIHAQFGVSITVLKSYRFYKALPKRKPKMTKVKYTPSRTPEIIQTTRFPPEAISSTNTFTVGVGDSICSTTVNPAREYWTAPEPFIFEVGKNECCDPEPETTSEIDPLELPQEVSLPEEVKNTKSIWVILSIIAMIFGTIGLLLAIATFTSPK